MLTYITDQQPGETDILLPCCAEVLIIKDMQGNEIYREPAPQAGWTHQALTKIQPDGIQDGADAYLKDTWVGSTEV